MCVCIRVHVCLLLPLSLSFSLSLCSNYFSPPVYQTLRSILQPGDVLRSQVPQLDATLAAEISKGKHTRIAYKFYPPHGWSLGEVAAHTPASKKHNFTGEYEDGFYPHRLTEETYLREGFNDADACWVVVDCEREAICG